VGAVVEFVGGALGLEEVPCQPTIGSILQKLHGEGAGERGGDREEGEGKENDNVTVVVHSLAQLLTSDCLFSLLCLPDVLLGHLDEVPDVQNKACGLLEAWWLGEREGREDMVPNMLLYLVARSLEERAKVRKGEGLLGVARSLEERAKVRKGRGCWVWLGKGLVGWRWVAPS